MKKAIFLAAVLVLGGFSQANAEWVRGYTRNDGTYVSPYLRTTPDRSPHNNYEFPGNFNPNTGRVTPGNPNTYLDQYYNQGHTSGGFGSYDPFNFNQRRR